MKVRLGYDLLELVIGVLLLVLQAAQEAKRETVALRDALVSHYSLHARLYQLLGHLRLQLKQVCHRRLVLRGHLQVWCNDEISAASLACQAEVKLRHLGCVCHLLNMLNLIYVIVWKVFFERTSDILGLLILALLALDTPGTTTATTSVAIECLALARDEHGVYVVIIVGVFDGDALLHEHSLLLLDLLRLLPLLLLTFVLLVRRVCLLLLLLRL